MAVTALAPLALACWLGSGAESGVVAVVSRLWSVVAGRMRLFGIGAEELATLGASPALLRDAGAAPRGAIDVERALALPGTDSLDRLRARAWYASAKTIRLDLALARRAFAARADEDAKVTLEDEEAPPRRIA